MGARGLDGSNPADDSGEGSLSGSHWGRISPAVTPLSLDQVRTQLHKVLVSGPFANADRMRRFLEFVVEHTLSSPDKPLKELTIGIELYSADFDPRISAVVLWTQRACEQSFGNTTDPTERRTR